MSIETIGASTSGSSRTASREADSRPRITSIRLMTAAKTGRLTETSEIFIARCRRPRRPRRHAAVPRRFGHADTGPVAQLLRAFGDHDFTGLQAIGDLHGADGALPRLDLALRRLAVLHDVDEHVALLRHQRLLRHHQHVGRAAREVHVEEHAGLQQAVAVRHQRAHDDGTRVGIDARVDARDLALEHLARVRDALRFEREAGLHRRHDTLGHGEIELDRAGVVERGDDRARRHQPADAGAAQADPAIERRANDRVAEA